MMRMVLSGPFFFFLSFSSTIICRAITWASLCFVEAGVELD